MIQRLEQPDSARVLRDVSDALRDALVPERIAERAVHQLERGVSEGLRDVLRARLARDLRDALRDAGGHGANAIVAMNLLNVRLSDAIEDRARDVLGEGVPLILRERLPNALHAAINVAGLPKPLDADAIDELAERLYGAAEKAVRQRLRDGLRHVIRSRVAQVARERLDEDFQLKASEHAAASDEAGERTAALLGEAVEQALHDRVLRGVMERFRCIVANSLHEATGERNGDRLAESFRRAVENGDAAQPRATAHGRLGVAATLDRLAQTIERPIADAVREQLMDGLRERIETTVRTNLEDVLRERLSGAIRGAIAHQAARDVIDVERLADSIHYELAEIVRARICDGIRARTAEAVRTRLAEAIKMGVSRSPIA